MSEEVKSPKKQKSRLRKYARRSFLIGSAAIAGGVAFGIYRVKTPFANPLENDLAEGEATITPFIKIDKDGVILITPRADKGQGAYSMQTYLLAEELDVDPLTVRTSVGMPDKAYTNLAVMDEAMPGMGHIIGKLMPMQMTGGSSTVPDMFVRMRYAAATARETLKLAAAQKYDVDAAQLKTENGHVILPSGEKVSYGALAEAAAKLKPVSHASLRPSSEWTYLGKKLQRTDIVAKSTGTQTYGVDLKFDDMLFATVRANPGLGGAVARFDASAAQEMRGVKKILPIKHGIAVIADNTWRAFQAAEAIDISWGAAPYPENSAKMWDELAASFVKKRKNIRRRNEGDVESALSGEGVITAEYRVPHLAHAPLEPMNAVVRADADKIEIWTGTQIPDFIQKHVAKIHGRKPQDIFVYVQPMGGSFGRRLEDTYVLQAVEIALSMPGVPIKMTWSREEDFAHDYVRPMGLIRARGAVNNGQVEAMDLDVASTSVIGSQFGRLMGTTMPGPDVTLTTGAHDQPYAIPNYRVTGYKAPEMVPVSSWRSVGASINGFHHEGFLDELIHTAGADPVQERLRLLSGDPVATKVLEKAADLAGWSGPKIGEGRGRGVAFVKSFGVPTAVIIDVSLTDQGVQLDHIYAAAEVGRVLDPVNFEAQLAGGILFGLAHAINCEITYENYAPQQANYYDYEGLRLSQIPPMTVVGLENSDEIRGIGEPGVPPAAPALANAIFAAGGPRLRQMPFYHNIDFA